MARNTFLISSHSSSFLYLLILIAVLFGRSTSSEMNCRGPQLNRAEMEATRNALVRCNESFEASWDVSTVCNLNAAGSANLSCYQRIFEKSNDNVNKCNKCIKELIGKIWSCNKQEARIWNSDCAVGYRSPSIPDPTKSTKSTHPTESTHPTKSTQTTESPKSIHPTPPTESTKSTHQTESTESTYLAETTKSTELPTKEDDSSLRSDDGSSKTNVLVLALLILFSLLGAGALCTGVTVCVLRFSKSRKKSAEESARQNGETELEQIERNEERDEVESDITLNQPLTMDLEPELSDFERSVVLDRKWLQIERRPIGNGRFGCVYKGTLRMQGKEICVAVKMLMIEGKRSELLKEAGIMQELKHENILEMLGVCLDKKGPMLVLPFMQNADLLAYIRSKDNSPTVLVLLNFAIEVGRGMFYLSSQRFVHRDLAARNCLLDENLRIKVGDFGLTRDVYEKNYYRCSSRQGLMPIRWMSIEAIDQNSFTTYSDVWSYGVLFWELMTRGRIPHPVLNYVGLEEFIRFLNEGNRLEKPEICSNEIYEIMLDCWRMEPNQRPSFDQIVQRIETVIKERQTDNALVPRNVNCEKYPVEEYYARVSQERAYETIDLCLSQQDDLANY